MNARLHNFVRSRARAFRYRVPLTLKRRFTLPKKIRINGKWHTISLPDELGIRIAFLELLMADCYRLESFADQVKTVLDIGANVGLFCVAARAAFPNAVIHAYEPNASLEQYLAVQSNVANATYFMKAVGLTNSNVSLDVQRESVCTTTKVDANGTVPATSIRSAIEAMGGTVDLVKMDCEGAEWEILEDRDAWSRVRHLAMEYHRIPHKGQESFHDRIRQRLDVLGFSIREQSQADAFGVVVASRLRRT